MKQVRGKTAILVAALSVLTPGLTFAGSGTEGASFLDIPVGAGPAAMGSAYTALAEDAYAPAINPAGLGFLPNTQFSGQHLSYVNNTHYEFLSAVHPLKPGRAIGVSAQYLGTGDITETDDTGATQGEFSSHYGSYNISIGQTLGDKLALGLTGKLINAKIADVSANAYAVDFGSMYKVSKKLTLAGTLTNFGTELKFLDDGDPLPMAFHAAAAYQPASHWNLSAEAVYYKTGLVGGRFGMEWRPVEMLSLRSGYKTETTKGLSPLAGLTTGVGIHFWGQELAYSWVPLGDLGDTHYVSLVMKLGPEGQNRRNLIKYNDIKRHRTVKKVDQDEDPETLMLMELMSATESSHLVRNTQAQ